MKANPGGQLNPEDIIGRGGDIDRLWEILAQQGVELTAERRMGKTTIVKQMAKFPLNRTFTVYRDLEKVVSPAEFVSNLLTDINPYLGGVQKFDRFFRESWQEFCWMADWEYD